MSRVLDLSGQKYGRLTVVEYVGKDKHNTAMWRCKCDCGNDIIVTSHRLRSGNTKSCGCLLKEIQDLRGKKFGKLTAIEPVGKRWAHTLWRCQCECGKVIETTIGELKRGKSSCGCANRTHAEAMKEKRIDISGMKFSRLTAIEYIEYGPHRYKWECRCECGKTTYANSCDLLSGNKKSCGCLKADKNKARGHHCDKRLVSIYHGMKRRCYNRNDLDYADYGGRGIKICEDWLDRENGKFRFIQWAMENGYSSNLSIDRIDVNGDYSPDNCRWADAKLQARNRRARNDIGVPGIRKTKDGQKYEVRIGVDYKRINVGRFDSIDEAIQARYTAEIEYYGQIISGVGSYVKNTDRDTND